MWQKMLFFTVLVLFNSKLLAGDYHYWIQGEFLYWSFKKTGTNIPLITSASLADPLPGALGQPGTVIQLSTCTIHPKNDLGFRFLIGGILCEDKNINLEVSYFLLPKKHACRSLITSGEPGSPSLAVPIFDTTGIWGLNGIPGETIAILPGSLFGDPGFFGNFNLFDAVQFQGVEVNAIFHPPCYPLEVAAGFGWMQFFESLIFTGKTNTDPDAIIPPGFFNFSDQFKTKNNFYGFLLGLHGQYIQCAWKLQGIITGGIGLMRNGIVIDGCSKTESGNLFFLTKNIASETLLGGIFSQPSNIGSFTQNRFGIMFETIIRGSYLMRECVELSLGYNFILLTHVARAADTIDRKINTTRTSLAAASRSTVGIGSGPIAFGEAGPAPAPFGDISPVVCFETKNFWAQGLIAGMKISF